MSERPPGHSVSVYKNIVRRDPTLLSSNIVLLKATPFLMLINSKLEIRKSQTAREAKEAIHIQKLDPELNRNAGKMVIPHVFDSILGIKRKNPCVASLLSQEVGSQDIGINLTQFHSCIDKRVNCCSNRAQRARNFISNLLNVFLTGHELSNAITFIKSLKVLKRPFTPLT